MQRSFPFSPRTARMRTTRIHFFGSHSFHLPSCEGYGCPVFWPHSVQNTAPVARGEPHPVQNPAVLAVAAGTGAGTGAGTTAGTGAALRKLSHSACRTHPGLQDSRYRELHYMYTARTSIFLRTGTEHLCSSLSISLISSRSQVASSALLTPLASAVRAAVVERVGVLGARFLRTAS